MATSVVYKGQRILVEVKVRLAGVPTDPTVMRCLILKPSGTEVILTYPDVEFTKRDTGFFEANITVDQAGVWRFRGEAAGVVDGVEETSVTVLASDFS